MRCPRCNHEMHLGRRESGVDAWHCNHCRNARRNADRDRRDGYNGTLVMGSHVPKRGQER